MDKGAAVTPPFFGGVRAGSRGPRGVALSGPTRPGCSSLCSERFAVCGPVAGALRAVSPRPFSPALRGPPSLLRARAGLLGAAGRPSLGSRLPPGGGLRAALARGAHSSPSGRGVRLAVWGLPCGALRASGGRPWPAPGAPCARLRLRRGPPPAPCGLGLAARPRSSPRRG